MTITRPSPDDCPTNLRLLTPDHIRHPKIPIIMTSQQFEKLYTANEDSLRNVLKSQDIYDDDLFQDTCLALCEHLQDIAVEDFRQAFLDKYDTLVKRRAQREIDCIHLSNVQLAALEIIDESQEVEILDRHIDYDLEQFTAECTIRDDDKERLQQLLDDYYKHPQTVL